MTESQKPPTSAQQGQVEPKAAQVVQAQPGPFTFSGAVGTPFNIIAAEGVSFGDTLGSVTIGKQAVAEITGWSPTRIKGVVPRGIKPGTVKIAVNEYEIETKI